MEDWITSLAKDSVAASSDMVVPSKHERLQRREAKKARRRAKLETRDMEGGDDDDQADTSRRRSNHTPIHHEREQQKLLEDREKSKQGLKHLSKEIRSILKKEG